MPGKRLPFGLTHRRRPAGLYSAGAQVVHEIAHVEQWPDIGGRIPFAAVAQYMDAFFDHLDGQRQIAGDDQITGSDPFDDLVIGHVKAGSDLHAADQGRGRNVQRLVGNQRQRNTGTRCGAKENVLDDLGAGVGVDPDVHQIRPRWLSSSFSQA